jgi:hypothetical protein
MYITELNGEPHPNFIRKLEFELNLIVAKSEFKPESCDRHYKMIENIINIVRRPKRTCASLDCKVNVILN